jgi:hypothetical protein
MFQVVYFHQITSSGLLQFKRNKKKKVEKPKNKEGNDQVESKKTTTNNKTMQTQQHGK